MRQDTRAILREEVIGDCRLILGDAMQVMPELGAVDHLISDPPYEQSLHDAKNSAARRHRTDGRAELSGLDFAGIDEIRDEFTELSSAICNGWFVVFCTIEGVAKWADVINPSEMKYKRGCIWIKPDSTPQLNGQGPAQGAECFVTAWSGSGYARWNARGKRGVYTHLTNPPDRHGGHPTEKPWRLMKEMILDFTNPGQLILDPFMGSGTTLVAAALTGRRAIGVELNPKYFDMACLRVAKAVGSARAMGAQLTAEVQEVLI
ncbi:DNA methylase [Rhodobacteraceae bacterium KLH11]|nr:DNA methylase [Rhodobacteraceae bacterium KLH11]